MVFLKPALVLEGATVSGLHVVDQGHTIVGLNMLQILNITIDIAKYSCNQVDATKSVAVQHTGKTAVTRAASLQPVPFSTGPWKQIGIDIVRPIGRLPLDCCFAITAVDYFSK